MMVRESEPDGATVMRTFLFLLIMLLAAPQAFAIRPLTVDQLEQLLAKEKTKSDKALSQELAEIELIQRLSAVRRARLLAVLAGQQSRTHLLLIADKSEFLDLPPADLVAAPEPDGNEQSRMIQLAAQQAAEAIRKMPNFFASRETSRFESVKPLRWIEPPKEEEAPAAAPIASSELPKYVVMLDAPKVVYAPEAPTPNLPKDTPKAEPGDAPVRFSSFRLVDRTRATILYRDNKEIVEAEQQPTPKISKQKGMEAWGEFGPFLLLITSDILKGSIEWSHWEQGPSGALAVLRFVVPAEKSHYRVSYCCVLLAGSTEPQPVNDTPEYSGEIAIDPKTGSVLRLVIKSRPRGIQMERADMAVEYGQVDIGGQSYICPVQSVGISLVQVPPEQVMWQKHKPPSSKRHVMMDPPRIIAINHVTFADYHMFRSEMRILPSDPAPPSPSKR